MASATSKTSIGLFTIGSLLLFILSLVFLGGSSFFDKTISYVLYFDGSVGGLNVGAPVVFRGVPLGNVTHINLVYDPKSSAVTIPVHIQINESSIENLTGKILPEGDVDKILKHMIEKGLSARLQLQNLVTSQSRIELDYHKGPMPAKRTTSAPNEIPTVPSPMDALQRSLSGLPIQNMARAVKRVLMGISNAIGEGQEIKESIESFHRAFDRLDTTLLTVNKLLEQSPLRSNAEKTMASVANLSQSLERELPKLLKTLEATISSCAQTAERLKNVSYFAEQSLNKNSPMMQDVRRLFKELVEAARSLRNLADMLNRNPEALLKGKQGGR
ncbi:MAG: MCE family protein [Desulfovibrio sp.]|nr:MCE family protein [Desulfovibrio sp.]